MKGGRHILEIGLTLPDTLQIYKQLEVGFEV